MLSSFTAAKVLNFLLKFKGLLIGGAGWGELKYLSLKNKTKPLILTIQ